MRIQIPALSPFRIVAPALLCTVLVAAACTGPSSDDAPAAMPMAHEMAPVSQAPTGTEIPAGDPVPTLKLSQDAVNDGVWTFTIATDMNLTLETAPYEPMRGHVHVYVDGVEKQMIADKRFELRDLASGAHRVSVALADTNHRDLLHGGEKIADGMEIVVPAAN